MTREILTYYVNENRNEVTDKHGRKPLFVGPGKRSHQNTLRNYIYALTRPYLHRECPHDTIPDVRRRTPQELCI
jgi:hypothetical protein